MRPQTRARPGASIPLAALVLLVAGCASVPPADDGYAPVTVADVQRDAAEGYRRLRRGLRAERRRCAGAAPSRA